MASDAVRRRWGRRALWLAAAGCLLAAGAWAIELAAFRARAQRTFAEARRNPPHPLLQVVPSPRADGVNLQGFRGDAIQPKRGPGEVRIFALGGSTTFGVTNAAADSYPAILQRLLQDQYPDVTVQVQNAGVPWYTTAHALMAYELRVRQFDPDIVIFFEAINDLARSFAPPWYATGGFRSDYGHYLGPYARLVRVDAEFLDPSGWLVWDIVRAWLRRDPNPFNHRDPENVRSMSNRMRAVDQPAFRALPTYRDLYGRLLHTVTRDGRVFVAGSQPFLYRDDLSPEDRDRLFFGPLMCVDADGTYPSLTGMRVGMDYFNQAARDVVLGYGLDFLDLEAVVPKTTEFFDDDVHLRRAGNERVAGAVAAYIDAKALVSRALARSGAVPAAQGH